MAEPVRIIYIAGSGRSGSTVLGQVLGAVPNWIFCGELRQGFSILATNQLCGCRVPAQECDFWRPVIEHAFGRFDLEVLQRASELTNRVSLHRHALLYRCPFKTQRFINETQEYAEIVTRVYHGVKKFTGCDVIVDTSKIPSYYLALEKSSSLDVNILHLLRDSRGVAYSNQRKKEDPTNTWGRKYLMQQNLTQTSVAWVVKNAFIRSLIKRGKRSLVVRYEDFVDDPARSVERAIDLMTSPQRAPSLGAGELVVGTQHILAGNPVKYRTGPIRLQLDDEWQSMMSRRHRVFVAALTWPMLATYGYLGRGDRSRAAMVEA